MAHAPQRSLVERSETRHEEVSRTSKLGNVRVLPRSSVAASAAHKNLGRSQQHLMTEAPNLRCSAGPYHRFTSAIQFSTTVNGGTEVSAALAATRNRCPSRDASKLVTSE